MIPGPIFVQISVASQKVPLCTIKMLPRTKKQMNGYGEST